MARLKSWYIVEKRLGARTFVRKKSLGSVRKAAERRYPKGNNVDIVDGLGTTVATRRNRKWWDKYATA